MSQGVSSLNICSLYADKRKVRGERAMPRIVHVEINADSPEEAATFYREVFDWHIQKKWVGNEDYWLVRTGMSDEKGINGGLRKRMIKGSTMVPTIEVPDFEEYAKRITSKGGKALTERKVVTGSGYLAYFQDPEGNVFAILHRDTDAK